ncbi:hypothetical protein GH714_003479 [Hevea brasiliensis]|uniref:Uncharacterized protein n=1 Tax=Hevea brasiliensis TaxID=3981 RepID=A0A6A6LXP3_HEVBR|nr:hypothetical protein GH714_003479 [Hevea brasiliensis]
MHSRNYLQPGPSDPSILRHQRLHRSESIWEGTMQEENTDWTPGPSMQGPFGQWMPSSSQHTMQQERTSFEFIPTQYEMTPFDVIFAPVSRPYTDVPSTSRYGFDAVEASEMYFAPHDSGLGTFASVVGLFGHYESGSMQNEAVHLQACNKLDQNFN